MSLGTPVFYYGLGAIMKLDEVRIKDFNFGDVDGSDESLEPKFQDLFYDEDSFYETELSKKKKFII